MPTNGHYGSRFDRRRFAVAGAITATGLAWTPAAGSQGVSIDGTPPAVPAAGPTPTPSETPADVAARLEFDQEAIVAFVRDEIAYEPYSGVLRGAAGTLRARAGNSADQAVLLAELLATAQIEVRYASGPLDQASADALLGTLPGTADEVTNRYVAALEASAKHTLHLDSLDATPASLDDAASALTSRIEATSESAYDRAVQSMGISLDAILETIDGAGESLPPLPPATLPDREASWHLWVQVPDGPAWIDLDPSLPEGTTVPIATETFAIVPDDWYHWLRFVITADEWRAGTISPREVVSLLAASPATLDVPIALSMASADELAAVGDTINVLLGSQKTVYPTIYAGDVVVEPIAPIVFAVAGEDATDALGGATEGVQDGETVAVWLVTEIESPDAAPVSISRALLDRATPEARASGVIDAAAVTPVELTPTTIGTDTPTAFDSLTMLMVALGRIPPIDEIVRYGSDQVFGPFGSVGAVLAGFRDNLGMDLEGESGYWSYPSGPNVTAFQIGNGETPAMHVDLIRRERTSLPLAGSDPAVHPLVLSGILDAIAEQMLVDPETRGEPADSVTHATGPNIAAIFAAAGDAGIGFRLARAASDLAGTPLEGGGPLATAALDAGNWLVVPESDVTIDGEPAFGWWAIDPATGTTRDQLADGSAGASMRLPRRWFLARGNATGYSFLTRAIAWVVSKSRAFICLGIGVAWGFLMSRAVFKGLRGSLAGAAAAGAVVSSTAAAGAMAYCF